MTSHNKAGDTRTEDKSAARWRQITEFMRNDLADGYYQPGQALPGETQLAEFYNTSRPTVRKAIAQLAAEGLLTVSHGRGTFVRPRPDRRLITTEHGGGPRADLLSPAYDLHAAGWEPVTVPSDAEREGIEHLAPLPNPCGIETAEILGVRPGHTVIYRFAYWQHSKTRARIHLESNTPAELLGTVEGQGLDRHFTADTEAADYYAHLAAKHGPLNWTTTVHAEMPTGDMIEDLRMEPTGTPVLVIRRVMLSHDGRPLEYTQLYAPGDRFEAASSHDHGSDNAAADYAVLRL
ncbi:GntR family transcriptional regulator [Spirillospora sp. NPDC049024]